MLFPQGGAVAIDPMLGGGDQDYLPILELGKKFHYCCEIVSQALAVVSLKDSDASITFETRGKLLDVFCD